MRLEIVLTLIATVACSSNPTTSTRDASVDVTYYTGGDGNVYTWNDAASACQPLSTDTFVPVKIAPAVDAACTDAQIVGLVTQCFDPSLPDNTACTAWRADPSNLACLNSCPIVSNIAASPTTGNPPPPPVGPWGPLVKITNPGILEFIDLGTCVATADPSPTGQVCADALNSQLECEYFACAGNCPIPSDTSDASALVSAEEAYRSCTLAADTGPCASYVSAVTTCVSALPANAPELFCVDGTLLSGDPTTFDPAAEKILHGTMRRRRERRGHRGRDGRRVNRARLALACSIVMTACDTSSNTCNGHVELCDRPYDKVTYAGTHDAYANIAEGFTSADQTYAMSRQLQDGIRVLHLEIDLDQNGQPALCHSICELGETALVDGLKEVQAFLSSSSASVVTLLTESNGVTTDQIATAFSNANLIQFTRSHALGEAWPTLGAMIASGERLVVFHADLTTTGGTPFGWMLDRFAWTWETPWDNETPSDFARCNADRGTQGNDLYVVDNYLENLPIENAANAALTNDNPFLIDRVLTCESTTSARPSFVMVNYYEVGDVFADVDVLNGFAPAPTVSNFPPDAFDAGE